MRVSVFVDLSAQLVSGCGGAGVAAGGITAIAEGFRNCGDGLASRVGC